MLKATNYKVYNAFIGSTNCSKFLNFFSRVQKWLAFVVKFNMVGYSSIMVITTALEDSIAKIYNWTTEASKLYLLLIYQN